MSDQLALENYLLLLKATTEVYVHGTLESSNDDVRKVLKHGLDETLSNQSYTFDLMTEYGYYEVSNVSKNEVEKVYNNVKEKSN